MSVREYRCPHGVLIGMASPARTWAGNSCPDCQGSLRSLGVDMRDWMRAPTETRIDLPDGEYSVTTDGWMSLPQAGTPARRRRLGRFLRHHVRVLVWVLAGLACGVLAVRGVRIPAAWALFTIIAARTIAWLLGRRRPRKHPLE